MPKRHWSDYECAMVAWYAAWYSWCLEHEHKDDRQLAALAYVTYMEYLEKKYEHESA